MTTHGDAPQPALAPPRFRALELPRNPFGALTDAEQAAAAVVELGPLVRWLASPRRCVQLVAPPGHGKTTTLLALRERLPCAVLRRAGRDAPVYADTVLLDEADAVGPLGRWRYLRTAARCVVASHRDLSWQLSWLGFAVTTVHVAVTDPTHVQRITAARLALVGDRTAGVPPARLASLQHRHGADLRAVNAALYDDFQSPMGSL